MQKKKTAEVKTLQSLRNIGPALEQKLYLIGITSVEDFMSSKPQDLYDQLQRITGYHVDRCVLYCFQGAKLNIPWYKCKNTFSKSNTIINC